MPGVPDVIRIRVVGRLIKLFRGKLNMPKPGNAKVAHLAAFTAVADQVVMAVLDNEILMLNLPLYYSIRTKRVIASPDNQVINDPFP